jgi:hypothetical protein
MSSKARLVITAVVLESPFSEAGPDPRVLQSIRVLADRTAVFTARLVRGLYVDHERLRANVDGALLLATALTLLSRAGPRWEALPLYAARWSLTAGDRLGSPA